MHHICVDTDTVWGIKKNGDVFVRMGVTPKKPAGSGWRTIKVASDLLQISALDGHVWGRDIYNHVQIFKGMLASEINYLITWN